MYRNEKNSFSVLFNIIAIVSIIFIFASAVGYVLAIVFGIKFFPVLVEFFQSVSLSLAS